MHKQWKRDKLSGYLTKYIGKEFEEADKHAKNYWHSRNVQKPEIERFWLRAKTYVEAVVEAHDLVYYTGATSLSMWEDQAAGVVWITGETERSLIGTGTSLRKSSCDIIDVLSFYHFKQFIQNCPDS